MIPQKVIVKIMSLNTFLIMFALIFKVNDFTVKIMSFNIFLIIFLNKYKEMV